MSHTVFDPNAPSLRGGYPRRPEDLPHGLITPPDELRELVAKEKAKYPPGRVSPAEEERILNEWTLFYYFEYLGHEVLYRQTPQGPDVLAVGFDEMYAYTRGMPPEEREKLQTWMDP